MLGLTVTAVMHVALVAPAGGEYQEAYNQAEEQGKPLLVLVGTDWCPGCRVMKQEMIPQLRRAGGLRPVVFTQVDADAHPELSRQLLRGNAIPQLVLYTPLRKLWRRTHLTGVHSPEAIGEFLRREIAKGESLDTEQSQPSSHVARTRE